MISVPALEEGVLVLLCYSTDKAPGLALRLTASTFTSRTNQKIAESALNYIRQFGQPPGRQLQYLLETDMMRGDEGKLLSQTLNILDEQVQFVQPDFILSELDRWLEVQRMTFAFQDAMESLKTGDVERAKQTVYASTSLTVQGTAGIWLRDTRGMMSSMDRSQDEFYSTGIPALDARGIQFERKTFSFMIAPAKKGKSWWLIEVGKAGLQHHHSVLHITNELSEEIVARRYLQAFFALTKREAKELRVPYFERDEKDAMTIQFREMRRESVTDRRQDIIRKLAGMKNLPPLLIKEFPTGSLTTEQLSMYLDSLEKEKRFKPDLLIIDYADLMKIDSASLRIDTGRLYRELRGIAMSRNIAMVSATQGNRESANAKVVDSTNVAEDWSKIGTADLVLSYSQTSEERKIGLARVLVSAARDESDRFMVLISQSYEIGQFCLDSTYMAAEVREEVERVTEIGDSK